MHITKTIHKQYKQELHITIHKQEAQGLGALLDKMEDNDDIKLDNTEI